MRTAISETERELVEYAVSNFLRAREEQEYAANRLGEVLGIGADEAIDICNVACNAQAALDMLGVEVYPASVAITYTEPEPDDYSGSADCWFLSGLFFALAGMVLVVGAICYVV